MLIRVLPLLVATGLGAGCSADVSQFAEPYFGATENQKSIIAGSAGYASDDIITGSLAPQSNDGYDEPARRASASVVRSSLPPLPGQKASRHGPGGSTWSSHRSAARDEYDPMPPIPRRRGAADQLSPMATSPDSDPIRTGALPPAGSTVSEPRARRSRSGWTAAGGTEITVGAGENADSLARRYNVPVSAILEANNLVNPDVIWPGRRLIIPSYTYASANAARAADAGVTAGRATDASWQTPPVPPFKPGTRRGRPAPRASGEIYIVRPSDSAAAIANKFNVTTRDLRAVNGLSADARLWIGQSLRIPAPGGGRMARAESGIFAQTLTDDRSDPQMVVPAAKPYRRGGDRTETVASSRTEEQTPVIVVPDRKPQLVASRSVEPEAAEAEAPPRPAMGTGADAARIFSWPANGPVISRFGRKASGERNDGINISVPRGAPVHAAANGVVIYSGNELKGYGNLVLVRHDDGWVSAYAHNASLKVERGDSVRKGQVIAAAGATGSVAEPQVHFELRRNSKPVDPMPLLAQR